MGGWGLFICLRSSIYFTKKTLYTLSVSDHSAEFECSMDNDIFYGLNMVTFCPVEVILDLEASFSIII